MKRLNSWISNFNKYWHKDMKKAILLLISVCVFSPSISTQCLESKARAIKFIDAKPCEYWRINDDWTRVYDKPDSTYDDFRYVFRNKYSLTYYDIEHTIDVVGKYKMVKILKEVGYAKRWKYVRYGKPANKDIAVKHGWILGTTVEDAEKFSIKKVD